MTYTTTSSSSSIVTGSTSLTGSGTLQFSDGRPALDEITPGCFDVLSDSDKSAVDHFCDQCLQLEPLPDYPDGGLLKRADVQSRIFDRICADRREPLPGNARLLLRILKELARRIQASIGVEEVDEYVCLALGI